MGGRWADAAAEVAGALTRVTASDAALYRVRLCAQGLRALAELGGAGAARRELRAAAREAAAQAAAVTPNAAGWLALAEAEFERAEGRARPRRWAEAAVLWERLERPPLEAYCRWREAEALAAQGSDATAALRTARELAARLGARPLLEMTTALTAPPRGRAAARQATPARRR